ncbi:MAG: hypothetical protein H0T87_10065 [Gammaproteobacteria bacterium]|nr:hypothetical protein [Gammaproteobacteria bacterium]
MRLMIKPLLMAKNARHFPEEGKCFFHSIALDSTELELVDVEALEQTHPAAAKRNGAPRSSSICFSLPLM